jgi:hypothetical protein
MVGTILKAGFTPCVTGPTRATRRDPLADDGKDGGGGDNYSSGGGGEKREGVAAIGIK